MKYFCPHCRNRFELRASYAGKRVHCQVCGSDFDVASRIMALRQPGVTVKQRLRQLEAQPEKNSEEITRLNAETEERLDAYWRKWSDLFGDVLERPPKSKFLDVMDLLDVDYGISRWRGSFQEFKLIEDTTARICPELLK